MKKRCLKKIICQWQVILAASAFIVSGSGSALAQCCSPGSPVGGDANQGVMNKNALRAIAFGKRSVSNNYFEGNKKSDDVAYVDMGEFNFSGLSVSYGLFRTFTIESELGYFISKKQHYNTSLGKLELSGSGLSDLAFVGKYRIISKPEHQFELTAGAGYKIPIGEHQQRNEYGILLPIDIQPTSGTHGYIGTLFLYKGFVEKHLRFFLTSRAQFTPDAVEFEKVIPTKYYRFGNFFTTSLFASYNISYRWSCIFQTRYEFRTQDEYRFAGNDNFKVYESSGGQKVFIVPQLLFEIQPGFMASVMFDYPLYQYYNQKQLATAYAGTVTLSKVFNFKKKEKTPDENLKN